MLELDKDEDQGKDSTQEVHGDSIVHHIRFVPYILQEVVDDFEEHEDAFLYGYMGSFKNQEPSQ